MVEKILFVDDDPNILAAYRRQLRREFHVEISLGGESGLQLLDAEGGFAVVIVDMAMPGMDGIQFLAEVRKRFPDVVRIMLTGNADQKTAVEAVNEGHIFRFLNKPCPPGALRSAIQGGVRQYRLIRAERDLLEQTLAGAVRILTEILSAVDPHSFRTAEKLREWVGKVAIVLELQNDWELRVAAMLSQIGNVAIPPTTLSKYHNGDALNQDEEEMIRRVPEIGRDLLASIPRLGAVANIVLYQRKCFDGSGFPEDGVRGEKIPLGSRMLKVASDICHIHVEGGSFSDTLRTLRGREGWYDPAILDALSSTVSDSPVNGSDQESVIALAVKDLAVGQMLRSDVQTIDNRLLIAAGHRISPAIMERIRNFAALSGIREPIEVEHVQERHQHRYRAQTRHDAQTTTC